MVRSRLREKMALCNIQRVSHGPHRSVIRLNRGGVRLPRKFEIESFQHQRGVSDQYGIFILRWAKLETRPKAITSADRERLVDPDLPQVERPIAADLDDV